MLKIDTREAMRALSRDLHDFQRRQIPFAAAQALTEVAKEVAKVETAALAATFKSPTPFTLRAFGVRGARKTNLTALVYARDIQAAYLDPYAFGGLAVLGKKQAMLAPIQIALNQYGNIPRGKLASLKGKPGYFVGDVKTKSGRLIGGLWQRANPPKLGGKRQHGVVQPRGRLVLLIEFTRPKEVTKHLPYEQRARDTVAKTLPGAWARSLDAALSTAR